MAITKEKKQQIQDKVSKALRDSDSVVFVNFHKLSVADTSGIRKKLIEEKLGYMVAKKSLVKRVLGGMDIQGSLPELSGELALAYGADPIAPAREIFTFQKKFKDQISIMGGIFEGAFRTREEMTTIASIPSLLTLRGQFVNLINSPIQGLAIALSKIAEKKEA